MVISEHKFFHVPNIVEGSHSAPCLLLQWVLGRSVLGICHIPRRGGEPIKVSLTCWCWLTTLKQRTDEIALAKLVANEGRTSGAKFCLYLFVLSLLGRQKRKCHSACKSRHPNKGLTSGRDSGFHVLGISWDLSPKFQPEMLAIFSVFRRFSVTSGQELRSSPDPRSWYMPALTRGMPTPWDNVTHIGCWLWPWSAVAAEGNKQDKHRAVPAVIKLPVALGIHQPEAAPPSSRLMMDQSMSLIGFRLPWWVWHPQQPGAMSSTRQLDPMEREEKKPNNKKPTSFCSNLLYDNFL